MASHLLVTPSDKVYSTDLPSDYLDYPLSSEGPAARASPGVDIGSAFRLRREPHSVILRKLEGVMLGMCRKRPNHWSHHDFLEQKNIALFTYSFYSGSPCGCGRPYRPHSVLASLMKHVTNWDRIVMSKMDELVTPVTNNDDNGFDADENDPRFGVRVNFAPILGQKISSQRSVVKEILFQGHKKAQVRYRVKNLLYKKRRGGGGGEVSVPADFQLVRGQFGEGGARAESAHIHIALHILLPNEVGGA